MVRRSVTNNLNGLRRPRPDLLFGHLHKAAGKRVAIGGHVAISFTLRNTARNAQDLLVAFISGGPTAQQHQRRSSSKHCADVRSFRARQNRGNRSTSPDVAYGRFNSSRFGTHEIGDWLAPSTTAATVALGARTTRTWP